MKIFWLCFIVFCWNRLYINQTRV